MKRCAVVPRARWIEWWQGEIESAELDALEEHLFECDLCTHEVTALSALAEGLFALGDTRDLPPVITEDVLERLETNANVAVYRARSGAEVHALLDPENEFVVLRLATDLSRLFSLDVQFRGPNEEVYFELKDVPFSSDEVIVACHRHVALTSPEVRLRFFGEEDGERTEVARVTLFNRVPM